jgi:hypothetical protein
MIDFQNSLFVQLRSVSNAEFSDMATPLLIPGEQILHTFKSRHEGVIFTNKRILAVNIHGLGGKKTAFTSLPYSKIQAYTVESAGPLSPEVELDLWFDTMGRVHFAFDANTDAAALCRTIASYSLATTE